MVTTTRHEANADQPNIVFLICHDLGQHLGWHGIETVRSPNIDRIAERGIGFSNCFCAAPQCSPSRAALFTGRYPHSNGVMGLTHAPFAWDLHPSERHLSGYLQDHGWHTALFNIQHETTRPEGLGFDEFMAHDRIVDCDATAEIVSRYVQQKAQDRQPFYFQIGFFEPHRPFGVFGARPDSELGVSVPEYLVNNEGARQEFAAFQGALDKIALQERIRNNNRHHSQHNRRFLDAGSNQPEYLFQNLRVSAGHNSHSFGKLLPCA